MRIFIDSSNLDEITKYISWGICDGVTSNPSIMRKDGIKSRQEMKMRAICIAQLIAPRPFSLEVTSDSFDEMVRQGLEYHSWAPNIAVKVTITTRTGVSCLPVIHTLSQRGVSVNATALMSFNQAMLAAKAGADYVSLFGGRIDDEGANAELIVREVRQWLDQWGDTLSRKSEIIVGSIRTTRNVSDWAKTGAHILTVTPSVLEKILKNARTSETVGEFIRDAEDALRAIDADDDKQERPNGETRVFMA